MTYDYVGSLTRVHSNVEDWTAGAVSEISSCGIMPLPVAFSENMEVHCFVVVLGLEEFLKYCKLNNKHTVFVYSVPCDIQEFMQMCILRECTEAEDSSSLVSRFCSVQADLLAKTTKACPRYCRQEIFVTDNGFVILTGAISEAYEEFLDALYLFCEDINDKQELENLRRDESNEEILSSLANELLADEKFKSIRGKRKRCLYVEQAYGNRIPQCREVRRPDSNADYMNSLLVDLVERVTDHIDLSKSI